MSWFDRIPLILALGVTTSHAQVPTMFPAPRFPAGAGAWRLAVSDFDSDGLLDVVTSNWKDDTLTLLHGAGDGTFYPPEVVGTADGPRGIATGDVDGDGYADLVVANADADTVTVHLGRGNGTFDPGIAVPVGDTPEPVALGDLNGDGHLDLVVGNNHGGTTTALLGDGAGGFSVADTAQTGGGTVDIALADLNGDGLLDIAVASTAEDVAVLLGIGHGQFAAPVFYETGDYPYGVALAELNGDGAPDMVITVNWLNTGLQVRFGMGAGAFGPPTTLSADGMIDVVIADLDGDADGDLLASRYSPSKAGLLVYANDGSGTFTLTGEFGVGPPPAGMVAADLDTDGTLDLVATSGAFVSNDDILAIRGLGDGSFDDAETVDSYGSTGSLAAADFNIDGHLDLALGIYHPDPAYVQIRLGAGDGTFGGPLVALQIPLSDLLQAPDLDDDGLPDLVVASDHKLTLARGNGDLTFTPVQELPFAIALNVLLAADLSGDGVIDLALGQSIHSIDVYLGHGDGTFPTAPNQVLAMPASGIADLAVGDINGDGLVDLVVGHSQGNDFTTVLGIGEGTFGVPTIPPLEDISSHSVALADLDADGSLDLVVGRYTQTLQGFGLSVFAGHGDGTFALAQELLPGRDVARVRIADMDPDGKPDVVVGLRTQAALDKLLAVAMGAGDGTLEAPHLHGLGHIPGETILADFDEDGRLDAAVAPDFFVTTIAIQRPPGTWCFLGQGLAGSAGLPKLTGTGTLAAGTPVSLGLTSGASLAPTWLVGGFSLLNMPFKGGTMVPMPTVLLGPRPTNSVGVLTLSGIQHAGLSPGLQFWFQAWIMDAAGPQGFAASNALRATAP